ncbi:MAG: hypothetical protein H6Q73_2550 [Firmicutes bacterium]|nr:hypothetical protein [Bacillota bacterium]
MKKLIIVLMIMLSTVSLIGCSASSSSQQQEHYQQEQTRREPLAQSGAPVIKNFREKKLLKDIYELRDQEGVTTYTYIVAENTGKLIFLGETIGYGISAATQYNNPKQTIEGRTQGEFVAIPQADLNGLYSPASAQGTWIMFKDPNGNNVKPVYVESRIIVSPFKLNIG